ncbi:MAG: HDIG domain-containing metalloprotein [Nitrospinota bacterium]
MEKIMSRDEALELLNNHIHNENLKKHCLASEAIMRELALRLGEDPELWGTTALLHDLDFEETKEDMNRHTLRAAEILEEKGLPPETIQAIKAHNAEILGLEREKPLEKALACSETITGLIVATALVMPDKKLASVKAKSVRKRMKEPAFARNVNREIITECEGLGISLDEFIELSLRAMQGVAGELGL